MTNNRVQTLIDKQREFQKAVGFPIDSILESDRNNLSEIFIFKAIEECVELRKEFPSSMNPFAKTQKVADMEGVLGEYSDVLLFLINFASVWNFTSDQILDGLEKVQHNNFLKLKEKKLAYINEEILRVPGKVSGVGQGNLFPKYVFIGQNPGETITPGYRFFSDPNDGSSKILLPILEELGITESCYFTNLVKCTTPKNTVPDSESITFWKEFLDRELRALAYASRHMEIIPMGAVAQRALGLSGISHPASVLRGNISRAEYKEEIERKIGIARLA